MIQTAAGDVLPDRTSCLVLSVQDQQLLVPLASVAEVISPAEKPEKEGSKKFQYGWISWRNQLIPIVSFEAMMGNELPDWEHITRIAVINTIGKASALGFYALVLSSIPRPVQVSSSTPLSGVSEKGDKLFIMTVKIEEDAVRVPDMDAVEDLIATLKKPS